MPTTCTPANLSQLAECFTCFTPAMQGAIRIYLLRSIAGLSAMTPEQLADAAKCFACFSEKQQKQIELYLMCQAVNV